MEYKEQLTQVGQKKDVVNGKCRICRIKIHGRDRKILGTDGSMLYIVYMPDTTVFLKFCHAFTVFTLNNAIFGCFPVADLFYK